MPRRAARPKLIRVRLHDRNDDSESTWAFDLGPAPGKRGARRVRINNVCFMHAKPTFGDVIVVEPDPEDADYILQWDSRGVPWKRIGTPIAEDGGRFAMIVDYRPGPKGQRWKQLCRRMKANDVIVEGAWGPAAKKAGRLYLAAPGTVAPAQVMTWLGEAGTGYRFTQIHPRPRKPPARAKPKATRARTTRARAR